MLKKHLLTVGLAVLLATTSSVPIFAETTSTTSTTTTMENCGAYLFEWRPIDCGNGNYFAILVGGNTLQESNVILNRGYDYAYTFDPMTYQRPWGTVPDLVNVDGKWGIPENWSSMPQDSQPVMQIVLKTNYKTLSTDKRYVNVVHLPSNIDSSTLPSEVRKYLINVDGSDAGAYTDTITPGWQDLEDGTGDVLQIIAVQCKQIHQVDADLIRRFAAVGVDGGEKQEFPCFVKQPHRYVGISNVDRQQHGKSPPCSSSFFLL